MSEPQAVTSPDTLLTPEEIALRVLTKALGFIPHDWRVAALHACDTLTIGIAAKDAEIAELTSNQRTCICSDDALCAHHDRQFIGPLDDRVESLEAKLREAESRVSGAIELAASLLSHIRFVLPMACGICDKAAEWLAVLQSAQEEK